MNWNTLADTLATECQQEILRGKRWSVRVPGEPINLDETVREIFEAQDDGSEGCQNPLDSYPPCEYVKEIAPSIGWKLRTALTLPVINLQPRMRK